MSATASVSYDTQFADSDWQAIVMHDLRSPLSVIRGQA